jgi:hypothetical protein
MHATEPQGGACPEPHGTQLGTPASHLAGLLTDPARFNAWIATAVLTAAQPPSTPAPDGGDRLVVTDAARRELAATEPVPVTGWCERCGHALPWGCTWDKPLCSDCVTPPANEANTGEEPVTAAPVLRDAALYLERHGWIQGAYYDTTSQTFTPAACMVGAIGMVCYGGPVDAPAQHFDDPGYLDFEEAVLHLDRYLLAMDGSESYEFNDARGRTLDDVTCVLRRAAAVPADELVDALRAIDMHNEQMAALSGGDDA